MRVLGVVLILEIVVDSSNIIVIDSMLNISNIIMSNWHTQFKQFVSHSILRVLELISQEIIFLLKLLFEGKLGHFVVDLGQLLHLKMMLTD